ncbi:hypothetical protein [Streptomyces sp. NPDC087300]|uniref:hypothetical protein n=1 Tax=Streptomyces sp. NPDC087300 TaxID=3365780 RepID=UPI00382DAE92
MFTMSRVGAVGLRLRPGRRSVLALLFAVCALFLGVCHGHQSFAPATAASTASAVEQHECPTPEHGAHAEAAQPAAAQPADRLIPDGAGAGRHAQRPEVREAGRAECAPARAGPPAAGHPLLIAIGIDRN